MYELRITAKFGLFHKNDQYAYNSITWHHNQSSMWTSPLHQQRLFFLLAIIRESYSIPKVIGETHPNQPRLTSQRLWPTYQKVMTACSKNNFPALHVTTSWPQFENYRHSQNLDLKLGAHRFLLPLPANSIPTRVPTCTYMCNLDASHLTKELEAIVARGKSSVSEH